MDSLTISVFIGLLFQGFVLLLVSFLLIRRFPRLAGFLRVLRALLGGALLWHAHLALQQDLLAPVVRFAIDGILIQLAALTAAECAGMVLRLQNPAASLSGKELMEFLATNKLSQVLFGSAAMFHVALVVILMLPYVLQGA